ncbi:MAG: tRNA 2-thiouridine(34) synthase MnmA [Patescibacteria group bacterium]|nr:tRNA 2-thiouridine(34) synthase MnmA [Patescibacteria group bacterium]
MKKKVFVGMSGGVDSSVAAGLLKQAKPNNFKKLFGRPTPKGFRGYEVVGVHLKCFNLDGCADRDLEDARRAAEVLGIPFYVFDFEKEYKKRVMQYMIDGYKKGITPNPDVMCNQEIKFGLFLEKALEMGTDYVATGHYVGLVSRYISDGTGVRLLQRQTAPKSRPEIFASRKPSISGLRNCRTKHTEKLAPSFSLLVAKDKNKDQSYFLWTLTQAQLKHCLFPLGDLEKPEVRKLAQKFGLLNAAKKDSQGICFLGKVGLEDFLKKYIKPKKGNIVDMDGNVLGRHEGVFYYTIGQRHGLHLDKAAKTPDSEPYYVADKILKTNIIIVAQGENNPALFKKEIKLADVNIIDPEIKNKDLAAGLSVLARVRYRQPLFKAKLFLNKHKKNEYQLVFDDPQRFVAIGQSAVIYLPAKKNNRPEMLGGGIIVSV